MDKTIQNALKGVYSMLGGNLDNVRELETVGEILAAIATLGVGDALKEAETKELPEAPENNGTYNFNVTVSGDETTYAWGAVEKELPAAPTTDGAYNLTVTVADGVATYSWESAE